MGELPPPVPPDCDLRDFPFMPIDINRLFASAFHARASDSEWRAGFTLWLKSFHQVPAGSLPDDDIEICRLAELGRDVKTWRKVKAMALHGWYAASDGRLYHDVVAEKTTEAWRRKGEQKARTLKARVAALQKRFNEASNEDDKNHIGALLHNLRQELSQALERSVTDAKKSATDREKQPVTETNRQGQGQGQGDSKKESAAASRARGPDRDDDAPSEPAPAAPDQPPLRGNDGAAEKPPQSRTAGKPEDQALALYQTAAATEGWPDAGYLTSTRRMRLGSILVASGGVPGFSAALDRAKSAGFLHDDAGHIHGWFDFDWLLDEQHFARLMEGRYDERQKPKRRHSNGSSTEEDPISAGVRESLARRHVLAGR